MDGVVRLGRRVMAHRRLEVGTTEVVGTVVAVGRADLTLRTADGTRVTVPVGDLVRLHAVPPRRTGRGPSHLAVSMDDLARVTADGWRAGDEAALGDWLLRAADGVTGRANSALVVGDPGRPLEAALPAVTDWYAARGLPAMLQVCHGAGEPVHAHAAGAAALAAGMRPGMAVLVMVADLQSVSDMARAGAPAAAPAAAPASAPRAAGRRSPLASVSVSAAPDEAWVQAYLGSKGVSPRQLTAVRGLLESAPRQVFASCRDDAGQVVAVGRLAVSPGWAGLFGLWTDPALRRTGIGTSVVAALLDGVDRHTPALYLQVQDDNAPAIAMYRGLGFVDHHRYTYLVGSRP